MKPNIINEKIIEQLGYPFDYWALYGEFSITEQDIKYLNKIKEHPCFYLVIENYQIMSPIIVWANIRINQIVFYEHFYNDTLCPLEVKNILFTMIGMAKGNLKELNLLNLLELRRPYVEQWLNSVTQKSSH